MRSKFEYCRREREAKESMSDDLRKHSDRKGSGVTRKELERKSSKTPRTYLYITNHKRYAIMYKCTKV